jgi:hypothetical protein
MNVLGIIFKAVAYGLIAAGAWVAHKWSPEAGGAIAGAGGLILHGSKPPKALDQLRKKPAGP